MYLSVPLCTLVYLVCLSVLICGYVFLSYVNLSYVYLTCVYPGVLGFCQRCSVSTALSALVRSAMYCPLFSIILALFVFLLTPNFDRDVL